MSLELAFTSAAGFEGMSRRRTSDFLMYGLPFMGFMIAGWYGIASVVQGKRDLKVTICGKHSAQEHATLCTATWLVHMPCRVPVRAWVQWRRWILWSA